MDENLSQTPQDTPDNAPENTSDASVQGADSTETVSDDPSYSEAETLVVNDPEVRAAHQKIRENPELFTPDETFTDRPLSEEERRANLAALLGEEQADEVFYASDYRQPVNEGLLAQATVTGGGNNGTLRFVMILAVIFVIVFVFGMFLTRGGTFEETVPLRDGETITTPVETPSP